MHRKPQYNMADDEPLILHEVSFDPSIFSGWRCSQGATDALTAHIRSLNFQHANRAALISCSTELLYERKLKSLKAENASSSSITAELSNHICNQELYSFSDLVRRPYLNYRIYM
jgi:hypothetical protein